MPQTSETFLKTVRGVLAMMLVAAGALLPATAHAASSKYGSCQPLRLPVALSPGSPRDQMVNATFCTPQTWASGTHAVDVMTAGATYNGMYWDWPQDPELYSYVDKTLAAGRATLTYDRIGTGGSSHPLSISITSDAEAYVLHQLVNWVHGQRYTRVNSVGHSYGSIIVVNEAATYRDVDSLVLTGFMHDIVGVGLVLVGSRAIPAALDPRFFGKVLDPGYLTTDPGARGPDFYNTSTADPRVIAYDEAHKDVVTAAGLGEGVALTESPAALNLSQRVTAPVMVAVGQQDAFFCSGLLTVDCKNPDAVRNFEAPYFRSAASVSAITIPDTGHDIALHPSANASFAQINHWIESL